MHYESFKSILSPKNGINIYRGCTHGCIYCDSRSTCYQIPSPFEDVGIKENAYQILDQELSRKRKRCMIGTGSMGDPYCHIEESVRYTRKCLEVIKKHGCGVAIQTKSTRLLQDLDLLIEINKQAKVVVEVTLTTINDDLCRIIEPNVSSTSERIEMLHILNKNNIPTIVWLCPILPFINDTKDNIQGIVEACGKAHVYGIIYFGMGLTLREGNREYYYEMLDKHFPGLKDKYQKYYHNRYEITSFHQRELHNILVEGCKKYNIILDNDSLFKYMQTFPIQQEQLSLF